MSRLKQKLLWVAVKMAQAIIFVVDTIEAVTEVIRETAAVAVEVAVRFAQRVSENEVIKDIHDGVRAVKDLTDVPETLHTIWLVLLWFWTFAMGLACSSSVATSWPAASTALCVTGVMYFAMLVGTTLFALFLIGRLSTAFRS
jgi:hypothetical protein